MSAPLPIELPWVIQSEDNCSGRGSILTGRLIKVLGIFYFGFSDFRVPVVTALTAELVRDPVRFAELPDSILERPF